MIDRLLNTHDRLSAATGAVREAAWVLLLYLVHARRKRSRS